MRGVERLLGDAETEFLLAAADDGAPAAGVAQLRFRYGIWRAGGDCLLEDLFVDETARGAGLGHALVEATLDRARARGCRRVELDVNERNEAAQRLYGSFGFSTTSNSYGARDLYMRLHLDWALRRVQEVPVALGVGAQPVAEALGLAVAEALDAVADALEVARGDRGVGRDPALDHVVRRAARLPRGERLLDGLLLERDVPPGDARQLGRRLAQRERLDPGEVVRLAVVALAGQHRGRHVGDVVARDRRDAALVGGAADHALGRAQQRDEVHVEVVAEERVRDARLLDVLLRVEVVAAERERRVGSGGDERRVDDPLHAGGDRGVDGRAVQAHAVRVLGRGDQEQRLDAPERAAHPVGGVVAADHGPGGLLEGRGARRGAAR